MMIQTRRRAKSPRWRLETAAAERLFEQKLLPTTSSSKRYVTVSQPVLTHDKNPKVIGLPENYKKLVSHLLCSPIRREGGGISRPRMWKESLSSTLWDLSATTTTNGRTSIPVLILLVLFLRFVLNSSGWKAVGEALGGSRSSACWYL